VGLSSLLIACYSLVRKWYMYHQDKIVSRPNILAWAQYTFLHAQDVRGNICQLGHRFRDQLYRDTILAGFQVNEGYTERTQSGDDDL
jgi:hypothetical protein